MREKPEDLDSVLVEEGRKAERPEDMVKLEQQPQAIPQTFARSLPSSRPAEEMEQQERVFGIRGSATAEAISTAVATPRSRARGKGRAAGRENSGIRGTTAAVAAAASGNCTADWREVARRVHRR